MSESGTQNSANDGLSILVVEDEVDAARAIERFLAFRGHTVSVAHGGHEALQIIRQHEFDVMLCDWMLGEDDDGIELLRDIQSERMIPAILMTGQRVAHARKKAAALGVEILAYKTKPIALGDLVSLIETPPAPRP